MPKRTGGISNTQLLLEAIRDSPDGMTFTEVQRHMYTLCNPGKPVNRMSRGHYCTYFLGGPYYHEGVLRFFCQKEGRYWKIKPDVEIKGPWKRNAYKPYVPTESECAGCTEPIDAHAMGALTGLCSECYEERYGAGTDLEQEECF